MGKAHSNAYRDAGLFFDLPLIPEMKIICGRNPSGLAEAQKRFGWKDTETDWKKVIRRNDIDLVDISSPPDTHRDIAVEAAKEGKAIFCEKPLALNIADASAMLEAAEKYGVVHAVCFNYRKLPAIRLAKKIISEGRIGEIRHIRAVYLQDWLLSPEFPLVWRLRRASAGSGSHGDLNVHLVDMARYLIGEFESVIGMDKTFIQERPLLKEEANTLATEIETSSHHAKKGRVDVDDAMLFLARFVNGAIGSFEASRFASGRKNYQRFEINGSRGSLLFNLERLNELEFYSLDTSPETQGFTLINATDSVHPDADSFWPVGHLIGYGDTFTIMVKDLIQAIAEKKEVSPNFLDGIAAQRVLDAVEESIRREKWIKVSSP